ncbi:MAG: CBS domain-containing protein [Alphaproteobacteria bacterium]|jgi:CBS domain-containing protein|nr:CBS domain-containing protein [Alphaproteobacteria bacterium]
MNVETILKTKGAKVVTITPETTVGEAAKILKRARIGAVVVSNNGNDVLGILSERDIVSAMAEPTKRTALPEKAVSSLMTRDVLTCEPGDTVQKCMSIMTDRRVRHLPVIHEDKMVGLISIGDVVKNRLEELESEAGFLRELIAS